MRTPDTISIVTRRKHNLVKGESTWKRSVVLKRGEGERAYIELSAALKTLMEKKHRLATWVRTNRIAFQLVAHTCWWAKNMNRVWNKEDNSNTYMLKQRLHCQRISFHYSMVVVSCTWTYDPSIYSTSTNSRDKILPVTRWTQLTTTQTEWLLTVQFALLVSFIWQKD